MFSLLDRPVPLPMMCAEYFSQVAIKLLECRKKEVLGFLCQDGHFVLRCLEHLGNSSILDLFCSIMFACTEEYESDDSQFNCRLVRLFKAEHGEWLCKNSVPLLLVGKLNPELPTKE